MKKILLVVSLAFGCSAVYAQTVVQIGIGNQVGNGPGSPLLSPGLVNNPILNIRQLYGNKVTGTIHDDQLGTTKLSTTIRQYNFGSPNPMLFNSIELDQAGVGNTIISDQLGFNNKARLWQTGTTNGFIQTSQSGNNNGTIIKQLSGSAYRAVTRQGPVIPAATYGTGSGAPGDPFVPGAGASLTNNIMNTITLEQSGQAGSAAITQEGSFSRFTGVQKGGTPFLPNTLDVKMDNMSAVDVNQDGTGNDIDIDQLGWQYARAEQGAGTNQGKITINQGSNRNTDTKNTAKVFQKDGDFNQATVTQNDPKAIGNEATVTQSGTRAGIGQNATVTVTQTGKYSRAIVTQDVDNSGGVVTINQSEGRLLDGSYAEVKQTGDLNIFEVRTQIGSRNVVMGKQGGDDNQTLIDQKGQLNRADVDQAGADNRIGIVQENDQSSGVGNKATTTQGATTSNSTIDINQAVAKGDNNTATVNQTQGDKNQAQVVQLKNNKATITQSGDDADVLGVPSTAIINQGTSTGGTATILQAAGTLGNGASISQTDISNVATINQLAGIVNRAASIQIGERNTSTINQSGSFNVLTFAPSQVIVAQTGNDNKATATQAAGTQSSNIAILQVPLFGSPSVNGNTATVDQKAGTNNQAAITQNDDNNKAAITQSGTNDAGSGNNSNVAIVQAGKGGDVIVTQAADGSNVLATQFNGNRNIQTIDQAKLGRALNIITLQGGDDNSLDIKQSGQENTGAVIQSNLLLPADPANGASMHTATLTQSGTVNEAVIGQGGLKNTSSLTQAGLENFASTLQYGSNNKVTANQTTTQRKNTLNVTQGIVGGAVPGARTSRNATILTGALLGLTPGDVRQSEDNVALVNQTAGENQVINLLQSGDNEQATISQAGSDNNNRTVQAGEMDKVFHTQTGSQNRIIASQYGEETDKGNTQTIIQSGNNNTGDVGQIKFGNVANLTQTGQDNNLLVGSTVRQIGENNASTINQTGKRGNITVEQGNPAGVTFGGLTLASTGYDPTTNDAFRNTTGMNQGGLDNLIAVAQQGDDGTATVNQDGNDNAIGIRQLNPGAGPLRAVFNVATATQSAGVANSLIDIEQFGRRNNGSASQTGTGVNNTINLNQRNDDNVAILSQTQGNQNVINVKQTPDAGKLGGRVEIAQVGQDNKARLEQSGYENKLTLTQTGDRNVLQQNGGNPFALQGGHNNTATLLQTGQDHTINLNQSGMMNTSTVTQMNL